MKWLDWTERTRQLTRIADALDRLAPPPASPDAPAEPSAVDYVSEERMALEEQAEVLGPEAVTRLRDLFAEQEREEAEHMPEEEEDGYVQH